MGSEHSLPSGIQLEARDHAMSGLRQRVQEEIAKGQTVFSVPAADLLSYFSMFGVTLADEMKLKVKEINPSVCFDANEIANLGRRDELEMVLRRQAINLEDPKFWANHEF